MSVSSRSFGLVLIALAGCDWPVTVGAIPESAPRADVGVTLDVNATSDTAPDVVADVIADTAIDTTVDAPVDVTQDRALPPPDVAIDVGCAAPRVMCGSDCVDLASDARHCGTCGAVCMSIGGAATCASGRCELTCASSFGDCDRDARNGCETSLSGDARNCGACGNLCPSGVCAMSACVAMDAGTGCAAGRGDCDLTAANGCEVNLASDARNCGACGVSCPAGQSCAAGLCR